MWREGGTTSCRVSRFGKSLLLDTLRALFAGNEPLFRGLDIHGHWDWNESHPVVRLSFDGKHNEPGDLRNSILTQLMIVERHAGVESPPSALDGPDRLRNLLVRLHHQAGRQVVVLVDEYDKPILDVIDNPDLARANRDYLERGHTAESARAMGGPMINGKDFVSIWVPFDPVLAGETAVTYIKGSHLHEDVLDRSGRVIPGGHSPSGLFGDLGENPQGVESVSWDINIGDMVVHDLNTVHMGGFGRTNSALRRAVALRYLGDDITCNESLPGIPGLPQMLELYRARWPDIEVRDGQKFDTRAFPLVR